MKFDTVIIGGGLSGLFCGIRLLQKGQKCAIVSTGHSALHFSSGSFDLCSVKDSNENIMNNVAKLIEANVEHPYAKMGTFEIERLEAVAQELLSTIGIETYSVKDKNHYRITPMGKLQPTWLTQAGYAVSNSATELPWKKVAIFNIKGYLDFFPHFIADEFKSLGVDAQVAEIEMSILNTLRKSPNGMIATSIARELDKEENREELLSIISANSKDCEVILLPACVGLKSKVVVEYLQLKLNKPVLLIPTLPPSVAGSSIQQKLVHTFREMGGVYMLGDTVEKVTMQGDKVDTIYSVNHTDIPFRADNYVLASGGFFSKGIIAETDVVVEPLLHLDVDFDDVRENWFNKEVFSEQEYQSFGVKTTKELNGLKDGKAISNLYVAGAILGGFNPIKEGSGGGVSILSALFVADQILKK